MIFFKLKKKTEEGSFKVATKAIPKVKNKNALEQI